MYELFRFFPLIWIHTSNMNTYLPLASVMGKQTVQSKARLDATKASVLNMLRKL